MELQQNILQQGIFSYINGKVVTMYLSNMHSIYGKVLATDNFTVLIQPFDNNNKGENKTNLIYKSSIVNIEINTLVDVKKIIYTNNQLQKNNNGNKNNNNENKTNKNNQPKEKNIPPAKLSLESLKNSNKDVASKKLVIDKYNLTKEDSEVLPELNVFSNDEVDTEKVDNKEEIQENGNEQAKYSPMNFLNDLQN